MKVIVPIALTLNSSTATASTYAEWAVGTAYAIGANVKVTTAVPHREYRALTASTGQAPASHPADWLDLGVTNPYRMLADAVSSQTTATGSLTVNVTVGSTCTHLGLFGLASVGTIQVNVHETSAASAVLSSVTLDLTDDRPANWSEWFYKPVSYRTLAVIKLPQTTRPINTISVVLTGVSAGSTLKAGHLLCGNSAYIGDTLYGVRMGIQDYSRKDTDEWGTTSFVPRAYAPKWQGDVQIERTRLDYVARVMASVRARPAVFDANPDDPDPLIESLLIYGWVKDWSVLLSEINNVTCSLEIEGLS